MHAVDERAGQDGVGDALGQSLQQQIVGGAHLGGDEGGHGAVVDGVTELVGRAGVVQIGLDRQVDAHRLRCITLVVEHADHGHHDEPVDVDPIGRCGARHRFNLATRARSEHTRRGRSRRVRPRRHGYCSNVAVSSALPIVWPNIVNPT